MKMTTVIEPGTRRWPFQRTRRDNLARLAFTTTPPNSTGGARSLEQMLLRVPHPSRRSKGGAFDFRVHRFRRGDQQPLARYFLLDNIVRQYQPKISGPVSTPRCGKSAISAVILPRFC